MRSLLPQDNEIDFLKRSIEESHNLFGQTARHFKYVSESMYEDETENSNNGMMIKVLFQSNPSRKLLRSLNWFKEDEEITPFILFLPVIWEDRPVTVKRGDKFQLRDTEFKVTEVNRNYLYGLWYVLKCVEYDEDRGTPDESTGEFVEDPYQ